MALTVLSRKRYNCGGRRRKYLCNRKRKAVTRRCCKGGIRSKVTLCNRSWRRISVKPFVNFLRQYRKGRYHLELRKLVQQARQKWCLMSKESKRKFYEQACRAKKRGYRT